MEIAVTSRLTEETEAVPEMFMDKVSVTEHEVILKQFELKREETRGEVLVSIVVLSESGSVPNVADISDTPSESANKNSDGKAATYDGNRGNSCRYQERPINMAKLQIRKTT